MIGSFANNLVLRHDLAGDPSFAELLGRVRETALDAFSQGELPFEELFEELYSKLQVGFALQSTPRPSLKLDGLQVEWIKKDLSVFSPFLTLRMIEGDDGLTAKLDYNTDLFEAATVARMLGDLRTLLESVVADPEQHVSSRLPPPIRPARPARSGGWQARFGKRLRRAARRARRRSARSARRALYALIGSHVRILTERLKTRLDQV